VDFSLVVCSAPPERLRERIEARQALGDDPSDATVEVLALQQRVQEPLTPDERRHAVQVVNDGTLSALEAQVDRLAAAWAASQGV
jgi:predicted kinase